MFSGRQSQITMLHCSNLPLCGADLKRLRFLAIDVDSRAEERKHPLSEEVDEGEGWCHADRVGENRISMVIVQPLLQFLPHLHAAAKANEIP